MPTSDIDFREYPTDTLVRAIQTRWDCERLGICWACNKPKADPTCNHPAHTAESPSTSVSLRLPLNLKNLMDATASSQGITRTDLILTILERAFSGGV